jgi:hypothetical protein
LLSVVLRDSIGISRGGICQTISLTDTRFKKVNDHGSGSYCDGRVIAQNQWPEFLPAFFSRLTGIGDSIC